KADICSALPYVCFSNRPVWVKRFQAIQPLQCRCRLRARASLRTRRKGPSNMGFEDEVEQSFGRPCRQTNGRFKRTYGPMSKLSSSGNVTGVVCSNLFCPIPVQ